MDDILSDKQAKESSCMCVHACINSMDPIEDGPPKIWKKQSQREICTWKKKNTNLPCLVPFGALHKSKKKKS